MKFEYRVETVYKCCEDSLEEVLNSLGGIGYELTSVVFGRDQHSTSCAYPFFKRLVVEDD